MRHLLTVLALFSAALVWSQFDMSEMFRMQSSPSMALARRDIRKELKLNRAQGTEIDHIEKDLSSAMQPKRGSDSLDSIAAPYTAMKEADGKVLAVLDDPQKKRLTEIRIQMQGTPALLDPEFSSQIGISDDQLAKLKLIHTAFINDATDYMMHHHDKHAMDELDKMRAACDAKMLDALTQAQRDKFKEMQGAPFKDARPKGTIF